jgi:hypothetical protein
VDFGVDDYGKVISSGVIEHLDAPAAQPAKRKKISATQKRALTLLCDAINTAGAVPPSSNHIPPRTPCVNEDLWKLYCYRGGIFRRRKPASPAYAFKTASEALLGAGMIGSWDGWVWPCGLL